MKTISVKGIYTSRYSQYNSNNSSWVNTQYPINLKSNKIRLKKSVRQDLLRAETLLMSKSKEKSDDISTFYFPTDYQKNFETVIQNFKAKTTSNRSTNNTPKESIENSRISRPKDFTRRSMRGFTITDTQSVSRNMKKRRETLFRKREEKINEEKNAFDLLVKKCFNYNTPLFLETGTIEKEFINQIAETSKNKDKINLKKYTSSNVRELVIGMRKEQKKMKEICNYICPKIFTSKILLEKKMRKQKKTFIPEEIIPKGYVSVSTLYNQKMDQRGVFTSYRCPRYKINSE